MGRNDAVLVCPLDLGRVDPEFHELSGRSFSRLFALHGSDEAAVSIVPGITNVVTETPSKADRATHGAPMSVKDPQNTIAFRLGRYADIQSREIGNIIKIELASPLLYHLDFPI